MYKSLIKIIASCGLVCACAPFGGQSNLERRVDEQDIQIRQMQPQQADTWNEVQSMRQEINQLKGELAALKQGEAAANPAAQAAPGAVAAASQPESPGIPITPGNAPDSSAYAVKTQPPQDNYGLAPETPVQPVAAPTEETWGKEDPKPAPVETPKKDISLALFDAGLNDYHARKYQAAERSFSDFLKNYPKHTQTAEANYYLGECYFAQNQLNQAVLAFNDVITKYPKSSSAPAAYYKQAICFSKQKQGDAARMRMQELIKKYPNSAEATRAKTFLKTNK